MKGSKLCIYIYIHIFLIVVIQAHRFSNVKYLVQDDPANQ